jgi:hypothetical protein
MKFKASLLLLIAAVLACAFYVTIYPHLQTLNLQMPVHFLRTEGQFRLNTTIHTSWQDESLNKASGGMTIDIPRIAKTKFCNDTLGRELERTKQLVSTLRASHTVLMPVDKRALELTSRLQKLDRCMLICKYGFGPHFVRMNLKFPPAMVNHDPLLYGISVNGTSDISVIIQLAPIQWLPHAVLAFLDITSTFKKGDFHRNAAHVLQAQIQADYKGGVSFMEYDSRYPHVRLSLGFAGRGGGNAIYINTLNNTLIHGPGTDRGGKDPESDTNFGRLHSIEFQSSDSTQRRQQLNISTDALVQIMQKQPNSKTPNNFVNDHSSYIAITSLHLLNEAASARLWKNNVGPLGIEKPSLHQQHEWLHECSYLA